MPIGERPIAPQKTDIDPRVGVPLTAFFLVVIGTPMLVQPIYELAIKGSRLQELDVFRRAPTLANIEKYENELAEEAIVAELARPYAQSATLSVMRQGNEKVMVGREGWLFHRPGVYYVTGFPFRSHYVKNDAEVKAWDPLPAIVSFKAQLERRGIEFVIVPIPVKAQIYPEKLTRLYDTSKGPAANVYAKDFFEYLAKRKDVSDLKALFGGFQRRVDRQDLKRFFAYLGEPEKMTDTEALEHAEAFRTGGVKVVDLSGALWKAKSGGQVYLNLDTHWTPLGMKSAARALADELRAAYPWLAERKVEFVTRKQTATRHGDLFYMLGLPRRSKASPEYTVESDEVVDPATGEPVSRDNPDSPVVLLGDSFTNVYSTQEKDERGMRWGEHAGFGEHLMKELGRPIEVIAFNGGAPTATRQELARRAGRRGLAGKRLVIWSFATRELIARDTEWRLVELPAERGAARAAAGGPVEVVAEVLVVSDPPRPGVDPYPEAVTLTKYRVISVEKGSYGEGELLAAEWVMRDFKLTRAARYRPGDVHRLKLIPLVDKQKADSSVRQANTLDDTDEYVLEAFWVVEMTPCRDVRTRPLSRPR